MSSVVISGDSSGTVTLTVPAVAGTNTVTVPASTGTVALLQTPSFTSTIGVGGATPSSSGAGITFPATQSASTDANTLDDYEEGTFTPTLVNGANSYGFQIGKYTKIGNVVNYAISLNVSSRTASANSLVVGGLPFTSANVSSFYQVSAIFPVLGFNRSGASFYAAQNQYGTTTFTLYGTTTASGNNYLPMTLNDTGTIIEVELTGCYLI